MKEILSALQTMRVPFTCDEATLHSLTAACLTEAGIPFEHEKTVQKGCRVDFFLSGTVIEIKNRRPSPSVLIKQLTRYTACDQVTGIILLCRCAIKIPKSINNKPIVILDVQRLWGVCVG